MRIQPPLLRAGRRGILLVLTLLATVLTLAAGEKKLITPAGVPAKDEFSRLVQLTPFVVRGQQLSVSVHARNSRDRRYAEQFAEEVLRVVHESGASERTGKGLVIIGQKGEPHPIRFFRQFLALADAGKLDPAVAARRPELQAAIEHWQHRSVTSRSGKTSISVEKDDGEGGGGGGVDLEFERIVTALPLPLEGIAAQLYQLAWFEKFDDAKVEAKLRALHAPDLERDLFARYDWTFYLPPRRAFDQVLDDIIAEALKDEDMGFVARVAVKGALLVVKPKIRQAIEGMRHGLMFDCVVRARTELDDDDVSALTGAYIEQFVPYAHKDEGPEHERTVRAVREELQRIETKATPPPDEAESAQPAAPAS